MSGYVPSRALNSHSLSPVKADTILPVLSSYAHWSLNVLPSLAAPEILLGQTYLYFILETNLRSQCNNKVKYKEDITLFM